MKNKKCAMVCLLNKSVIPETDGLPAEVFGKEISDQLFELCLSDGKLSVTQKHRE